MKTPIYYFMILCLAVTSACKDFTEITPKGFSVLDTVEDLDMLLNNDYTNSWDVTVEYAILSGDLLPYSTNIPNIINSPVTSLYEIEYKWSSDNRLDFMENFPPYTEMYSWIGKVANAVINNADEAKGARETANALKAEAQALRAWFHYLLVNTHAKAYDPATAATDGGIPYAKQIEDLTILNPQYTVREVYDFILEDIDAALTPGALSPQGRNRMRVGKSFAHAVKAMVLMSLRRYDEAYEQAELSLALNNTISDHNSMISTMPYGMDYLERPQARCAEDLFYTDTYLIAYAITDELAADFEQGTVFLEKWDRVYMDYEYDLAFYGIPVYMFGTGVPYFSGLGLTTINMYLVQAEVLIRNGDHDVAMEIINKIRKNRILPEYYTDKSAADATEAFEELRRLSRTENFASVRNFLNLKRWNTEEQYKATLHKTITYTGTGGPTTVTFDLEPESPLWIFPFPINATSYNPNLKQN